MSATKKETNTLYRQKYFVDSSEVIRYRPGPAGPKQMPSSSIIRKENGKLSNLRVPMNKPAPPADAQIEVKILRNESRVSGLRIACPCGRHAEVDLNGPADASTSGKVAEK